MTDPRKQAEKFVQDLRGALGERVGAASLFGSAARGEWIDGTSDINVLVLLDDIDAPLLGRAAGVARNAAAKGVRPLLMEVEEWRRAADVFTIELADMKDAAISLHGEDAAAHSRIDPAVLRLQAEREMRAKLLHLHSGMLMAAEDRGRLGQMFVRALPSFMTYMRAALRLAGRPVPQQSGALIEETADLTGFEAAAFRRVLEARMAGGTLELGLDEPLADQFNDAAETLAAHIDAFGR